MFELFKRREFSDYISDTLQFFRQNGKHFFKTYFTISGGLLMVLVVVSYFLFKVYLDFFLKVDTTGNNATYLKGVLFNNLPVVIIVALLIFLFMVLLSMFNYAIPVIYLNLYDKHKGTGFEAKEVLSEFKKRFKKILLFFLGVVFLVTPVLFMLFGLLVLLCLILVGIPMLLFAIPAAFSWITLSFYEYMNTDKGLFEALRVGFSHVKSQFFSIVGSCMILYIMIQVSMTVFSFIPYAFGMASVVTSIQNPGTENDPFSTMRIMLLIVMVFSMLVSYILNNLLIINQGLVYYSRREYNENVSSTDSIDLIGRE
jgi:hypothetical protein